MATQVYAGGLPYSMSQDDLTKLFEKYGEVEQTKLIEDRETGRSKGFGFVTFANKEDADDAIKALHNTEVDGRKITVNEAAPRAPKSGGGGSGGYGRR